MQYKILLVKNRYSKNLKLDKYLIDWFENNIVTTDGTKLEIIKDELSTDFDITPEIVSNGTYTGIICDSSIITKLRTIIPDGKYNAVILYAGNLSGGIRVSCCNGKNREEYLYPDTDLIQICKINDSGKTANHELHHAFVAKLNRCGIAITDIMDTYTLDGTLKVDSIIDTNREITLNNIKPYWNIICSLESVNKAKATLIRQPSTNKQTLGTLTATYNGKTFTCKTLELPDLNNLYDKSCIPKGTYKCSLFYWKKHGYNAYVLHNVPNHPIDEIYIHVGNYNTDTLGCILVGASFSDINKDGITDITSSKVTLNNLINFFDGCDFTLTIQ